MRDCCEPSVPFHCNRHVDLSQNIDTRPTNYSRSTRGTRTKKRKHARNVPITYALALSFKRRCRSSVK